MAEIVPAERTVLRSSGSVDALRLPTLLLLMASVATVALGYGVILPVFPALLNHGMDAAALSAHVGLLTASYMLALTLSAPAWGGLSDRTSRRAIILIGLGLCIAGIVVLIFASRLWVLYAGQVISGIATAAIVPASLAYVAERSGPDARSRRFAWMGAAVTVGLLGGPALGGWLAGPNIDVLGVSIEGAAARPLVAAAFLAILALSGVAVGLSEADRSGPSIAGVSRATHAPMRGVAPWLLLSALAAYGLGNLEVATTLRGQQDLRLDPSRLAALFVGCGIVMLAVQALFGSAGLRPLDPRRMAAPAFAAMAIALGLASVASEPGTLMIFIAGAAAGYSVLVIALADGISRNAVGRQGGALGQQMSAAALGQAIGSAATGFLSGSSITAAFWAGAGVLAIGAAVASAPQLRGRDA